MNKRHLCWIWLSISFCFAVANAQENVDKVVSIQGVEITLGASCKLSDGSRPPLVEFVLEDHDNNKLTAVHEGDVWIWRVPQGQARQFHTLNSHGSVRFTGGRTGCRKSIGLIHPKTDKSKTIAIFDFPSCDIGTVDITLVMKTTPDIGIDYVRHMPKEKDGTPCDEKDAFTSNKTRPFVGFLPRTEKMTLNLTHLTGPESKEIQVHKFLKKTEVGKFTKGKAVRPDELIFQWAERRAEGGPSAPTLSSIMPDIDAITLNTIHFESLILWFN